MSMMGVKQGTRTFSTAEQTSSLKADPTQNLSATDRERALGDQNLGDVLNKVADANYVDPAKTRKVGNNQLDKDAFLKLMLAQMKHQDPTNPMQSHEMAAQLAQFTSLEQLNNINTTLTGMKEAQSPNTNFQALNFIGKRVSGDSSKVTRVAGDTNHEVNFQLLGDAAQTKLTIKDADGNVVRKIEMGGLKKGENTIRWNGLSDDGMAARPGEFKITIEAANATGGKVYAKTEFDGKITGVNYTGQGPVLLVGTQSIKLSDVKKIVEDGQPATPAANGGMSGKGIALPPGLAATAPQPAAPTMAIAESRDAAAATALAMAGGGAKGAAASPLAASSGKAASAMPQMAPEAPAVDAANAQASAAAARAAYPAGAAVAMPPAGIVVAQQDDNVPPAEDAPYQGSIMNDVAMSREMMEKVAHPK